MRQELSSFQCWTSLTFHEMNMIDNDSNVDSNVDAED